MKQRALPKSTSTLSTAKKNKIDSMKATGHYTIAQIAESCGLSTAAVSNYLRE